MYICYALAPFEGNDVMKRHTLFLFLLLVGSVSWKFLGARDDAIAPPDCGYLIERCWDCRDFEIGLEACTSSQCDFDPDGPSVPSCDTWFERIPVGNWNLKYNRYDYEIHFFDDPSNHPLSEFNASWVTCSLIGVCTTDCVLGADALYSCVRNVAIPQMPIGGFNITIKGPCPLPPLPPPGPGGPGDQIGL